MFQRKTRRFGRHSNHRSGSSHGGMNGQGRMRSNSFSNSQSRNKFRPALSVEKLLEKYNLLAKEAMSLGDKTLCENYLQHADHYMRIIEDKNKMREQNKVNVVDQSIADNKNVPEETTAKVKDLTNNTDNKE